MRYLLSLFLLIHYFVWWTSPQEIVEQHAIVTGGTLIQLHTDAGNKSGFVEASAEIDCVTIEWVGKTVTGLTFRSKNSWQDGCLKTYVPVASQ